MGPELEFNILTSIMFDSMSGSRQRNNFQPRKWYISPCAQTKKNRREKGGFWPLVKIY